MSIIQENQNAYMYSIHTLQLGIHVSKTVYDMLVKKLIDYSQKNNFNYYHPDDYSSCLVFNMFKEFGFTYCYAQYIYPTDRLYHSCCFYMIINPRKLFQIPGYQYICITPPDKAKDIIPYVIAVFHDLEIDFINFDQSIFIKRLDFCTNIKMENQQITKDYMKLLRKGKHVYRSRLKTQYSQKGHRQSCPKHEFTITGKSFELSIYNKKEQMESSHFSFPDEERDLSENQIRIELRIFYPTLYNLRQHYKTARELLNHIPELSQEYINRYLQAVYGKGNFFQYCVATNMIMNSPFHTSTKIHMINFIKKISKTSLQDAICFFEHQDNFPDIPFIMNKFNELQLSPITISSKSHYTMFYHPIHYILTQNVNLHPFPN